MGNLVGRRGRRGDKEKGRQVVDSLYLLVSLSPLLPVSALGWMERKSPEASAAPGPSVFRENRTAPCYLVTPTISARTPCAAVMMIACVREFEVATISSRRDSLKLQGTGINAVRKGHLKISATAIGSPAPQACHRRR